MKNVIWQMENGLHIRLSSSDLLLLQIPDPSLILLVGPSGAWPARICEIVGTTDSSRMASTAIHAMQRCRSILRIVIARSIRNPRTRAAEAKRRAGAW